MQCSPPGTYRGALDVLGKLLRNEVCCTWKSYPCTIIPIYFQGVFALYKGATPPAAGWAAIDSVLLGSLHNYRLFLIRQGMVEDVPGMNVKRLTLIAHGTAGVFAGCTRLDEI